MSYLLCYNLFIIVLANWLYWNIVEPCYKNIVLLDTLSMVSDISNISDISDNN